MISLRPYCFPGYRLALLLLIPFAAFAQQTNSLESLRGKYETIRQEIESNTLATYSNALVTAIAKVKEKGDLESYLALDAERKAFESAMTLPAGYDCSSRSR